MPAGSATYHKKSSPDRSHNVLGRPVPQDMLDDLTFTDGPHTQISNQRFPQLPVSPSGLALSRHGAAPEVIADAMAPVVAPEAKVSVPATHVHPARLPVANVLIHDVVEVVDSLARQPYHIPD